MKEEWSCVGRKDPQCYVFGPALCGVEGAQSVTDVRVAIHVVTLNCWRLQSMQRGCGVCYRGEFVKLIFVDGEEMWTWLFS